MTKARTRLLLGFALAPMIPAVVFAATSPGLTDGRLLTSFALLPIFYLCALVFTCVLGIPAYLLMQRFALLTWWATLIAGAVLGGASMTMIQATASVALFGAAIGASEALLIWITCRFSRSSRDNGRPV
jgi:hypothetical protein